MTDDEIRKFINDLRDKQKFDEAYIGFFQFGGGSEESFIKANRQGLEMHAAELLEAAVTKYNDKSKSYGLDEGIQDIEGDFSFQYVDLKVGKRGEIKPSPDYKETWTEKYSLLVVLL
jgi:hypothetical protein